MYQVDGDDEVVRLDDVPAPSAGASEAHVLCNDHHLFVAYRTAEIWEEIAVVEFQPFYYALSFGPPNDEAFDGHPLATRGLERYGVFEVRFSSWIRDLERMNRVHPSHDPQFFSVFRHFIFTFHDSTLECVAQRLDSSIGYDGMVDAIGSMRLRLLYLWDEGQ
jgi:hypothetical protein